MFGFKEKRALNKLRKISILTNELDEEGYILDIKRGDRVNQAKYLVRNIRKNIDQINKLIKENHDKI